MRKIALLLVLFIAGLVISGCGVQVKQDGNKIFTDADKEIVFKYSVSALEKEGYKITDKDSEEGYVNSVPEEDNEVFAEVQDSPRVNVQIREREEENDVMVEIEALISGDVDEKESTLVARRAVDLLIGELNKYGMFTVSIEESVALPTVDTEKFLAYLEGALQDKGYTVSKTDVAVEGTAAAASEYNEPLKVKIEAVAQGNQTSVALLAAIEGNYDRNGNEQKTREAVAELTAVVEDYPIVDKGIQHSYAFISPKTAFRWSKMALDTLGYIIDQEDVNAMTLSSQKDGLTITVVASDAGDNTSAVAVSVKGEGGDSKESLEGSADAILTDIKDELALYQISRTDTKMFAATPLDKAYSYAKNALVGTGYKIINASREKYVVAGVKSTKPVLAVCAVNSLGSEGIAIEATAHVNGKKLDQAEAEQMASQEVARIVKYLRRYDKIDVK